MTLSPLSPQHAEPTEADWATIVDITGAGHAPQVTELLLVQAIADERATVRRQQAVIDAVTELADELGTYRIEDRGLRRDTRYEAATALRTALAGQEQA